MPSKRKAAPPTTNSESPKTPVAHKLKKHNPPRLLCPKTSPTTGFSGRLTRGRKRFQLENLEDVDEVEVIENTKASVKPKKAETALASALDGLTLGKTQAVMPMPRLAAEIRKLSIEVDEEILDTKEKRVPTKANKKAVVFLPPISESSDDGRSSEDIPVPIKLKTPGPTAKLEPNRRRDIAELEHINLIEDTKAKNFECFTRNVTYRDFELTAREELMHAHAEAQMKMQELRRLTKLSLMGFSPSFLQYSLADLLEENGNPESLDKLMDIYSKKFPLPLDQNANSLKEKGHNVEEIDNNGMGSSPDMFSTPKKQTLVLPPRPPHTGHTLRSVLKNKAPIVFPSAQAMTRQQGGTAITPDNPVFQFQGEPQTVKIPRLAKPGEIAFSQSGSPILTTADVNNIPVPHTPVQNIMKPVRIQLDNGDGGNAIDVDIVYRGNPNEGDAKVFRAFMTDVRGVVTARTTARGKRVQQPLVPPKSKAVQKAAAPASASSVKKPQWLN